MSSVNQPDGSGSIKDDSSSQVSQDEGTVSEPSVVPEADNSIKPITFSLEKKTGNSEVFQFKFQTSRGRYEMKNKFAHHLLHPVVSLTPFLQKLYCLKGSLLAQSDYKKLMDDLMQFYKGAVRFGQTTRFPAPGVYVDLDSGACSTYYHYFVSVLWKHWLPNSQLDPRMLKALITFHLDPCIKLLENYGTHFEGKDANCGIYDREFFEAVHSGRWVVAEENNLVECGHYEMKNLEALAARPFVDLNQVLSILYRWRIWDEGNWLLEKDHPITVLKKLFENPVNLVEVNKRFPPDGVYLDVSEGRCYQLLLSIVLPCGCFRLNDPSNSRASTASSAFMGSTATSATPLLGRGTTSTATSLPSQGPATTASSAFMGNVATSRFGQGTTSTATYLPSQGPAKTASLASWGVGPSTSSQGAVTSAGSAFGLPPTFSSSSFEQHRSVKKSSLETSPKLRAAQPTSIADVPCSKCGAMAISRSSLLAILQDYESHWEHPQNGIYDRAHFEKHFSARWIPAL